MEWRRKCAFCNVIGTHEHVLRMCGRCYRTRYCKREHQRQDWENHKTDCLQTINEKLCRASRRGKVFEVQFNLLQGANVNCQSRRRLHFPGTTPLWVASYYGNNVVVEVLIDAGANVNQANPTNGCSPLYVACQNSHHDTIRLLNQHNANINQPRQDGWTPLIIMTYIGRFETVQLLLSFPTIDTTITFLSKTAIEWAEPNVKATEWKGWESLENRIDEAGRAKCLDLLSSHLQSTSSTFQGETKTQNGNNKKKKKKKKKVKATADERLWNACIGGRLNEVRTLLDLDGIDINCYDYCGNTPLNAASQKGHVDIVKVLLKAGANVNQANTTDGTSPLFIASQHGHVAIVKVLIKAGGNVNQARTMDGGSPLYIASEKGNIDLVKVLIEAGVDVNHAANNEYTALGRSCQFGHLEIVRLLLQQQPNIDVNKGARRWSPLALANYGNHTDVIQLLTNAGAK